MHTLTDSRDFADGLTLEEPFVTPLKSFKTLEALLAFSSPVQFLQAR